MVSSFDWSRSFQCASSHSLLSDVAESPRRLARGCHSSPSILLSSRGAHSNQRGQSPRKLARGNDQCSSILLSARSANVSQSGLGSDLRRLLTLLQAERDALSVENGHLRSKADDRDKAVQLLGTAVETERSTVNLLHEEVQRFVEERERVGRQRLEDGKATKRLARVSAERDRLALENKELKKSAEHLVKTLEEERASTRRHIDEETRQRCRNLEASVQDLATHNQRLSLAGNRHEESALELRSALDAERRRTAVLARDADLAHKQAMDAKISGEKSSETIQSLQKRIRALEVERDSLNSEIDSFRQRLAESVQSSKEDQVVQLLRSRVRALQQELSSLKAQKAQQPPKEADAESEIRALKKRMYGLEADKDQMSFDNAHLQSTITGLEGTVSNLRQSLEQERLSVQLLMKQIAELRESNAKTKETATRR